MAFSLSAQGVHRQRLENVCVPTRLTNQSSGDEVSDPPGDQDRSASVRERAESTPKADGYLIVSWLDRDENELARIGLAVGYEPNDPQMVGGEVQTLEGDGAMRSSHAVPLVH